MRTHFLILLSVAIASAGCTTLALERHTINQSCSAADYRYRATLHCLATVAANPDTLPSYAMLSSGLTSITNTGVFNSLSAFKGSAVVFQSSGFGLTGTHAPMQQWTVSPVADYTQLEAMRCRLQLGPRTGWLGLRTFWPMRKPIRRLGPILVSIGALPDSHRDGCTSDQSVKSLPVLATRNAATTLGCG